MTIIVIDRYEPDYDNDCSVCGATPVVTIINNNKIIWSSDMCGPCTWGESETIDPDTWNN